MSKFIEVIAIVEGKTEQVFVEWVLQPYLAMKNIFIYATQVTKPGQKGGDVRFSRVSKDIELHLKQRKDIYVTTLVDYYGTKEWPGLEGLNKALSPAQLSEALDSATQAEMNDKFSALRAQERFIPYMAMHEFEALLFSDSKILAAELGIGEDEIQKVLDECGEPEAINNHPDTAPSKRLNAWSPGEKFPKTTTGIAIAQQIGIDKMREQCPLFNSWLEKFEALVGEAA